MTWLHAIGDRVRDLFALIPLSVVRVIFLAVLISLWIWVLRLPRERVLPERPTGSWGENLKVVASVALGLQVLIYLLF